MEEYPNKKIEEKLVHVYDLFWSISQVKSISHVSNIRIIAEASRTSATKNDKSEIGSGSVRTHRAHTGHAFKTRS